MNSTQDNKHNTDKENDNENITSSSIKVSNEKSVIKMLRRPV